jgi:cholesterol oxidase
MDERGGGHELGKTAWLSRGFEQLLRDRRADAVYDVLIVGSGYGGAVTAAGLAGCTTEDGVPISVCVLERGKEYLPGMFPARLADVPRHVRFSTADSAAPRGTREGLFDVRVGADVSAVVANGLGGGSLINAGVMEEPCEAVLEDWPDTLGADLKGRYLREARALLGAQDNTISGHPGGWPAKTGALEALARSRFREARITAAMRAGPNPAGVALEPCCLCGDCATGCNEGAKDSLDANLLVTAWSAGAEIYTGATVLRIERDSDATWRIHTVHTDRQLRERQGEPAQLKARHVILAAGTFGSTEILMRSQSEALEFSPRLGRGFSANGDALAVIYGQRDAVNAVSDENRDTDDRNVGPTITGILDFRRKNGRGPVVEEIAIPGSLRRAFEETVTTVNALHSLAEADLTRHHPGEPRQDPCAVDGAAIRNTSIVVMMGDDGAAGALYLVDGAQGDGAVQVRWPALRDHPLYARQLRLLRRLVRVARTGGRVLPNPLWQVLPESLQFIFDAKRGPAVTVHPLGGCAMGKSCADGVVSDIGLVYRRTAAPEGTDVWPGLAILDGSIVRRSLGINPALTIAALALRAVPRLRRQWGFEPPGTAKRAVLKRPWFREVPVTRQPQRTAVQVVERMSGEAWLKARRGGAIACQIELTLRFKRRSLADLVLPVDGQPVPMTRALEVEEGELRVFRRRAWKIWRRCGAPEDRLAGIAELQAPLSGTLTLFDRRESGPWRRRWNAYPAWFLNRGLHDLLEAVGQRWREGRLFTLKTMTEFLERGRQSWALTTRAGEVRELSYELRIGAVQHRPTTRLDVNLMVPSSRIAGVKDFTYRRRANPWRQLMQFRLERFPGLACRRPALELDPKYLVAQAVPLFKIVDQNDQVAALADVASFAAYLLRLLLTIHAWSFRRPQTPTPREPQRLPRGIPGRLPDPEVQELHVDDLSDGTPVRVRLTRYLPRERRSKYPVVMIHGYSASGTTFAHHAVKPNMAEYFYAHGRDVWLLDLRTSSGMPTARHPWAFEEAALADLPAAVAAICGQTGSRSVDVFAHCMGSAMFSMAVLADPERGNSRWREERRAFPGRVRRAALSQIAPIVVMSPANVFRGYAMSYLRHFLPFADYEFRVAAEPSLKDQLLDRLLATLPYPEWEFDVENPLGPWRSIAFVGTRHRMDALYGRDFSLADRRGEALLSDQVLEYIDDLFGPLSIDTVAQAIHFARSEVITNRFGRNEYVLPANLLRRWTFPTLSIHGVDNGLADVATLERFRRRFKEYADIDIRARAFPGFGHQDSLIGRHAPQVFAAVFDFFSADVQVA